jgi:hypothetical protein
MQPPPVIPRLLRRSAWTWRWLLNLDRTLPYRLFDRAKLAPTDADLQELRANGILTRPADHFFADGAMDHLTTASTIVKSRMDEPQVHLFLTQPTSRADGKRYRMSLLSGALDPSSPLVLLALDPALLRLVNAYLGMRGLLRAITVWLDAPTVDAPTETQLWHRDDDDYSNLKVFIYLNEVGLENGPFCFIPRTHPDGDRQVPVDWKWRARISDEEMLAVIPRSEWRICTGPASSIVLADTRGYHKGLQPSAGHRLLTMFHYTSGRPNTANNLQLSGNGENLLAAQRYALGA